MSPTWKMVIGLSECFLRTLGCRSSPQTRTTDRTSPPQTTPGPPRWEPLEPSLKWSYVFSLFLLSSVSMAFCFVDWNINLELMCVLFSSFQTNETKDTVCLFNISLKIKAAFFFSRLNEIVVNLHAVTVLTKKYQRLLNKLSGNKTISLLFVICFI